MRNDSVERFLTAGHGKHWKIRFAVLLWLLLNVIQVCKGKSIPDLHYIHTNVCHHIDPEPIVHLANMFNTNDYFFPQYFTETKCASAKTTSGKNHQHNWATCMNGQHHCVTRYRIMEFLRIPNPGQGTFANSSSVYVRVPVACECSSYILT